MTVFVVDDYLLVLLYIFFHDHEIARAARACGYEACSGREKSFYFALHELKYVIA